VFVVARPIPVLAEASVLFAGMSRMPLNRFIMLSTLSNRSISMVYAAIGAMSATVNSFLLAMAGSILVPWLAMIASKKFSNSESK
jgi:membrane protein DedA with SNARE-associated domain